MKRKPNQPRLFDDDERPPATAQHAEPRLPFTATDRRQLLESAHEPAGDPLWSSARNEGSSGRVVVDTRPSSASTYRAGLVEQIIRDEQTLRNGLYEDDPWWEAFYERRIAEYHETLLTLDLEEKST
jgi:hypothetical protein